MNLEGYSCVHLLLMNLIFSGIYMAQQSHGGHVLFCPGLFYSDGADLSVPLCLSELPYWDNNCDIENHLFWC